MILLPDYEKQCFKTLIINFTIKVWYTKDTYSNDSFKVFYSIVLPRSCFPWIKCCFSFFLNYKDNLRAGKRKQVNLHCIIYLININISLKWFLDLSFMDSLNYRGPFGYPALF